jgi:hypothetical protein
MRRTKRLVPFIISCKPRLRGGWADLMDGAQRRGYSLTGSFKKRSTLNVQRSTSNVQLKRSEKNIDFAANSLGSDGVSMIPMTRTRMAAP